MEKQQDKGKGVQVSECGKYGKVTRKSVGDFMEDKAFISRFVCTDPLWHELPGSHGKNLLPGTFLTGNFVTCFR